MINIVTAGLREQEINVTQSWPGILKSLRSSLRPVSRLFVYLYKRHFPKTMQFCATCTRNRPKHHQNTGGRHEFVHMLLEVNRSLSTVGSLMHVLFACYSSKQTSSLDWNKSFISTNSVHTSKNIIWTSISFC